MFQSKPWVKPVSVAGKNVSTFPPEENDKTNYGNSKLLCLSY